MVLSLSCLIGALELVEGNARRPRPPPSVVGVAHRAAHGARPDAVQGGERHAHARARHLRAADQLPDGAARH